ncbi:hypothetical protein HA402_002743 [Bradysia odoriphaga]|nr:hypothetical protein HA402_002743 [Bradysia odoriphaga]
MKTVTLSLVLNCFIFESLQNAQNRKSNYETLLLNDLLKDYDKRSRPVEDVHSPLTINFSISLHQILQVDEKHQVITTNMWRFLFWKDDFLKWNPENYGNITQLSIARSEIWAPDIQLYNLAEYDTDVKGYARNILTNDGKISDGLPMLIKSTCKIDVTWFPFDEQKCLLIFGSWSFSSTELRLELSENAPSYMNNGEWQVLGVTAETGYLIDQHQPTELYVVLNYTIHLKRRAVYYFFNLLVPCGLIGFLAILGFTLPPESGEKLPLGATILFSLIVFLNMISESMPASSDAVPLLGTYFNCIMFSIALSVVSTIVVNLNMNAVNPKHIQGRSKKLLMYWLPQLLCMKRPSCVEQIDPTSPISKWKISDTNAMCTVPLDAAWKQQWIFIAAVVDRLCLICSLLFTFVSVTVFLANAF